MRPIVDAAPPYEKKLLLIAPLLLRAATPCLSPTERAEALTDAARILRLVDPQDARFFWQAVAWGMANEPLPGFERVLDQLRRLVEAERP